MHEHQNGPRPPSAHPFPLLHNLKQHSPRDPAKAPQRGRAYKPPIPTSTPFNTPSADLQACHRRAGRHTISDAPARGGSISTDRHLSRTRVQRLAARNSHSSLSRQLKPPRRRSRASRCAWLRQKTASVRRRGRAPRSRRRALPRRSRARRRQQRKQGSAAGKRNPVSRTIRRKRARCLRAIRKPISFNR